MERAVSGAVSVGLVLAFCGAGAADDGHMVREYFGYGPASGLGYADYQFAGGPLSCHTYVDDRSLGAVCFPLPSGTDRIRLSGHDSGGSVAYNAWWVGADGRPLQGNSACSSGPDAVIDGPDGAVGLVVFVHPGGATCGTGFPVMGSVYVLPI